MGTCFHKAEAEAVEEEEVSALETDKPLTTTIEAIDQKTSDRKRGDFMVLFLYFQKMERVFEVEQGY